MFLIPRKLIEGGDVSQIEISHSAGGMVAEERGQKYLTTKTKQTAHSMQFPPTANFKGGGNANYFYWLFCYFLNKSECVPVASSRNS